MINFLVISGIIGLVATSFTSTLLLFGKYQNNLDSQMTAKLLRFNLMTHLQNDQAWTNTMNDTGNSGLDCLRIGNPCNSPAAPIATIRNAGNTPVILPGATRGFDLSGNPCNTYDSVNGSTACPYHLEVSWEPICTIFPCNPPSTVKLTVTFSFSGGESKSNLAASKYNFTLERSSLK